MKQAFGLLWLGALRFMRAWRALHGAQRRFMFATQTLHLSRVKTTFPQLCASAQNFTFFARTKFPFPQSGKFHNATARAFLYVCHLANTSLHSLWGFCFANSTKTCTFRPNRGWLPTEVLFWLSMHRHSKRQCRHRGALQ